MPIPELGSFLSYSLCLSSCLSSYLRFAEEAGRFIRIPAGVPLSFGSMVGVAAEAFPAGAVGEMAAGFRAVAGIAEEAAQAAAGSSEARNSKLAMNTKHFLNA